MCVQVTTTDDNTVIEQRKFAAVCWGPGDPATTMVMLNEHGQLVDVLYAGQLSGNIRRTRRNAQGSEDIFSDPAKVWHLHCHYQKEANCLISACTAPWRGVTTARASQPLEGQSTVHHCYEYRQWGSKIPFLQNPCLAKRPTKASIFVKQIL